MSDQPVEYRGHNENAHTGKIEIGWPPSEEPTWNPERIRAVALEHRTRRDTPAADQGPAVQADPADVGGIVTAPDQTEAAERSARELERRLRLILPPSHLADAYAFALAFIRWEQADHWRRIPPAPNVLTARREGDPPTEEFLAAKAAITRKDEHE